jgi:hypothetical protein
LVGVFDMARFFKADAAEVTPYAAYCYAIFFKFLFPAVAGRFLSGDAGHGPRQRHGYQVTPNLSLSCPMHAGNKTDSVQKMSPPLGEASGIRRDTDGKHQKKAYEKQIIR